MYFGIPLPRYIINKVERRWIWNSSRNFVRSARRETSLDPGAFSRIILDFNLLFQVVRLCLFLARMD